MLKSQGAVLGGHAQAGFDRAHLQMTASAVAAPAAVDGKVHEQHGRQLPQLANPAFRPVHIRHLTTAMKLIHHAQAGPSLCGLDIAVADAALVEILSRLQRLQRDARSLRLAEGPQVAHRVGHWRAACVRVHLCVRAYVCVRAQRP